MQTFQIYASTGASPTGQVAIGVVLHDGDGHPVSITTRVLGHVGHDEAAYQALLSGLWRAKRTGAQRVRVYVDRPEVVAQLSGEEEVPPTLVGLYLQVRAMLNAYRWRTLEAVDREKNAEAALAAMEAALERAPEQDDVESLPLWRSREHVLV